MQVEARISKDGRWYLVEIPLLDGMTQGRTKKEAMAMAVDWLESMIDKPGFQAETRAIGSDRLVLSSNDPAAVVALALRRRREAAGLSLAEAAARVGATSKNTYARYERGTSVPSIVKFANLLRALDPKHDLALAMA